MPRSILLADDSALARRAVRNLLSSQLDENTVYIEADCGLQALDKAIAAQPDLVVLDIAMPGLNGVETAWYISRRCPNTVVLAISSYDVERVIPRVRAGIRGFVRKDLMGSELVPAIQALLAGKTYFATELAAVSAAGVRPLL